MSDGGRPTKYREAYADIAHNYCLLGATNDELAVFFDVSPTTIDNWMAAHEDFAAQVRKGRASADAAIALKLYQRAMGYEYRTRKVFVYRGQPVEVDHPVHMPPDVGACIFWLRNRRRRDWQERARPPAELAIGTGVTFAELEEASRRAAAADER